MGQIGFVHGEDKNYFVFSFSSVFAFKQAKEQILFQVQPLEMFNIKKFMILGLHAKFSEALYPKSRQL